MYELSYTRFMVTDDETSRTGIKEVARVGTSKTDLSAFPPKAKGDMGYQIHLVQTGQEPDDWKPLGQLGRDISGVYEIRLSSERSIFRTAYVTKFGDRIVVLHRWQKKTRATAQSDKDLIVARYREAKEKLA